MYMDYHFLVTNGKKAMPVTVRESRGRSALSPPSDCFPGSALASPKPGAIISPCTWKQ